MVSTRGTGEESLGSELVYLSPWGGPRDRGVMRDEWVELEGVGRDRGSRYGNLVDPGELCRCLGRLFNSTLYKSPSLSKEGVNGRFAMKISL